jgi:hypothetical protein
MKTFSERMGLKPIKVDIQKGSIDTPLKTALWNGLYLHYFRNNARNLRDLSNEKSQLFYRIWLHYFLKKIDEIPNTETILYLVKETFFRIPWNEMLDLLEFIPNNYKLDAYHGGFDNQTNRDFFSYCNDNFEHSLSAYRFVDMLITEITSDEEITSIESALNSEDRFKTVKTHIKRSLELYSDRINPDYRNSIKESISAVEAFCVIITEDKKATLGKALAIIEKKHNMHGSLKTAFSALYGYSSDEGGIRHALLDESELKQEDAKFMLVTCSAFINYLSIKISN